jgi:hypothetical protein
MQVPPPEVTDAISSTIKTYIKVIKTPRKESKYAKISIAHPRGIHRTSSNKLKQTGYSFCCEL